MSLEQYQQKRQAASLSGAIVAINMARTLATDLLKQAVSCAQFDDPPVLDRELRNRIDKKKERDDSAVRHEFLMSYLLTPVHNDDGETMALEPARTPNTHRLDASAVVAVYNHSYESVVHVAMYVPRMRGLIDAGNMLKLDRLLYDYQPSFIRSVLNDNRDEEMVVEIEDVSVANKGVLVVIRHPITMTLFAVNLLHDIDNYEKFKTRFAKSLIELPHSSSYAILNEPQVSLRQYCEAASELSRAALPAGYRDVSKEDSGFIDDFVVSVLNDQDRFFNDLLCRDVGVRLLAAECGLDCNVSSFDFELSNKMQLARYLTLCLDSTTLENPVPEIPEWATYLTRCT